jgi:phosphohistidine phosphatase
VARHDAAVSESTGPPGTTAIPRRLVLVRHAKARQDAGGTDRSRRLTDGGRTDAAQIGTWLAGRLPRIDAGWTSSAVRAVQTYAAMAGALANAPEPEPRDDLYEAGPDDLFDLFREVDDSVRALLVVGHNPTIERVQAWLTGDDRGFPAGAAAIVELNGGWADIEPGAGRLVDFTVP